MAHKPDSEEKVVFVGDSRVRKRTQALLPADYSAYPGKSEAFIPNFLLKEWMVGAVVLVGFMVLVLSHPSPLGYPANPTNTQFIPMPDWYFLFMYQLLKYNYMAESFKVLGTLVIPGLAFGGLLLAPFLDRGKERRFYRRPITSALMFLSLISLVYLTYVSWDHYQHELEARGIVPEHIKRAEEINAGREKPGGGNAANKVPAIVEADSEGAQLYAKATCVTCHAADLKGMAGAIPSLRGIGDVHDKEELLAIINEGFGGMQAQTQGLKDSGFTDEDIDKLADWLSIQKAATE